MAHPERDPNKVCFLTFGCQMNRLDSELAAGRFEEQGIATTPDADRAGTIVINTCSVRKHAEDRALSNLGRFKAAKRRDPHLVLVLMGCMAQREGDRLLARYPYLDVVCGTRRFTDLPRLAERARSAGERIVATDDEHVTIDRKPGLRPEPFRSFVSIMRGCDSFCSYCIVPYVRGRQVSRHPDKVEREVRGLVDDGCVEVTLLGQNVAAYRHDETDLAGLLERLDRVPGLRRLRFITSHPADVSDRLLRAVERLPSVCEHLHMPAQSGADRILSAMNRGYTAEFYRERLGAARESIPGVEIASDFIVGFPGETDADFAATTELLRDGGFNQCFIFKYSPRPGTRAAEMADDVPDAVKKERNQALLDAQDEAARAQNRAKEGREFELLVEGPSKRDPDRLTGRTRGNDIAVFPRPEGPPPQPGEFVTVRITDSTPLTLIAEHVRSG